MFKMIQNEMISEEMIQNEMISDEMIQYEMSKKAMNKVVAKERFLLGRIGME